MSCNGCRVLRKGCNENCILRQSLGRIESPQAQANATLFVTKFFGRAGLMSFLSAVPDSQRPVSLFQSLLFEACGRTVNPVNGAVGLLWTGNWHICQAAVDTVLRGGVFVPEFTGDGADTNKKIDLFTSLNLQPACEVNAQPTTADLDLCLTAGGRVNRRPEKRVRAETPSEESETTTLESGSASYHPNLLQGQGEAKILRMFF